MEKTNFKFDSETGTIKQWITHIKTQPRNGENKRNGTAKEIHIFNLTERPLAKQWIV